MIEVLEGLHGYDARHVATQWNDVASGKQSIDL
jgi:hypothetical protein